VKALHRQIAAFILLAQNQHIDRRAHVKALHTQIAALITENAKLRERVLTPPNKTLRE